LKLLSLFLCRQRKVKASAVAASTTKMNECVNPRCARRLSSVLNHKPEATSASGRTFARAPISNALFPRRRPAIASPVQAPRTIWVNVSINTNISRQNKELASIQTYCNRHPHNYRCALNTGILWSLIISVTKLFLNINENIERLNAPLINIEAFSPAIQVSTNFFESIFSFSKLRSGK